MGWHKGIEGLNEITNAIIIKSIYELSLEENFCIKWMCDELNVNESSYYSYKKSLINMEIRKSNELIIVNEIIAIFEASKRKLGARRVKMQLDTWCQENNMSPINLKRIRRIMKENKLYCSVRKANPYKQMWKANETHRTFPNIIERKFNEGKAYEKLLTDITYLNYANGKRAYLSAIKDSVTGEIISYTVKDNLSINLSLEVIDQIPSDILLTNTIIHSDQGAHYTSPQFSRKLKEKNIIQFMSRRSNCLDNAPMESFFGHLKDEINIKEIPTLKIMKEEINKYMIYYNQHRKQWTKKKLTPVEYRNQLLSI